MELKFICNICGKECKNNIALITIKNIIQKNTTILSLKKI